METGEVTNGVLEFVAEKGSSFVDDIGIDNVTLTDKECPRKFPYFLFTEVDFKF